MSNAFPQGGIRLYSLDVGVLASDLNALLLGALACDQGLDVVLHRVVDELVLRLRLDHPGALRANHLYGALDVDLGVEACAQVEQYNSGEYDSFCGEMGRKGRREASLICLVGQLNSFYTLSSLIKGILTLYNSL